MASDIADIINTACDSDLAFYAYSRSGRFSFGACESTTPGIHANGFVISPFDNSDGGTLTITGDVDAADLTAYLPTRPKHPDCIHEFPERSVTKADHEKLVKEAVEILKENPGKIVCARAMTGKSRIDIGKSFRNLSERYPDAFTFCFRTPQSDLYMGASPELLLRKSGTDYSTMALAGTRPAGSSGPWDVKNIEEQRLVTDHIMKVLADTGLHPECGDTFSKKAGYIEHICTPVSASGVVESGDAELLSRLSPTPALCGSPTKRALDFINSRESFSRGYYGGYCGPTDNQGNFEFYVNLRSGRFRKASGDNLYDYALFAGGGITGRSEAESEWTETERKLTTIKSAICHID